MAGPGPHLRHHLLFRSILTLLLTRLHNVAADDVADALVGKRSTFLYPAGGDVFYFSDVVNATFISPIVSPKVTMWCGQMDDSLREIKIKDALEPGVRWFLAPMNASSVKKCWFNVMATDKEQNLHKDHGGNSAGFTINQVQRAETTLGLPLPFVSASASAAVTSSTSLAGVPVTTTSSAEGATPSANPSYSLSVGAIVGICIGVVAAVAAMVFFGFVVWRRRRGGQAEVESKGPPEYYAKQEIGKSRQEMADPRYHQEMGDPRYHQQHELAG